MKKRERTKYTVIKLEFERSIVRKRERGGGEEGDVKKLRERDDNLNLKLKIEEDRN